MSYRFDRKHIDFKKVNATFWEIIALAAKYVLFSAALAALYYVVFALFVSTDKERQLKRENKMYQKVYSDMKMREDLVSDVIDGLQLKDRQIYQDIFYAEAPDIDPIGETDFLAVNDTIPDKDIIEYSSLKSDALLERASKIEEILSGVVEYYSQKPDSLPPLELPLEDVSYAQVGASVGTKINPFYKIQTDHSGLDMIVQQGAGVFAAAGGTVTQVVRSRKGLGNYVEISHKNGYVTRYCHLGDIFVSKGQSVRVGRKIGEVGVSGGSFVPHLHYEVLKDGVTVDPVHYFFASVTPYEYANMLYMSVNTGQSMD